MLAIRELYEWHNACGDIFRRRYNQEAPTTPHHIAAFFFDKDELETPICYIHFERFQEILLCGGACVDNKAIRRMSPEQRAIVRERGGLYHLTLTWALKYFSSYPAVFGYCGDPLAERIDLGVGSERTQHKHLLVYWMRDLPRAECERLIAQAHSVGPF